MTARRTARRTAVAAMTAAGFAVVAASVPSTRLNAADGTPDDACIQCHVATFEAGLAHRVVHSPFFDRQCRGCHLLEGAASLVQGGASAPGGTFTGSAVSQEVRWTRRRMMTSGNRRETDHRIILPGLAPDGAYRFRIVISDQAQRDAGGAAASQWIGLQPAEVPAAGTEPFTVSLSGLIADGEVAGAVTLSRLGESTLLIRWQTDRPRFGWLEVEPMQSAALPGAADAQPAASAETHPPLREPEEETIDVCYTCHPASAMGTSHPVRVYASGSDIRVPDDLPTVRDGMITCVTCHDPHGADGKDLVRETVKTKLCVACHLRFRGTSKATMF